MQLLPAATATMPSGWVDGFTSILLGAAVVPFLLSLLLDALALGIQRGRWRPLLVLLAANGAGLGGLSWTLSLAMGSRTPYQVDWAEFVGLLFGVGSVVALWHGIPRVMRSVLRRRREDLAARGGQVEPVVTAVEAPVADLGAPVAPQHRDLALV
jgi:hypothetical protein